MFITQSSAKIDPTIKVKTKSKTVKISAAKGAYAKGSETFTIAFKVAK